MANKQFNSVDGYSVGNASVIIDGNGNVSGNAITATANVTSPRFISNVATGTAPFVVTSTTQVANLNVATAGSATTATSATNAAALLQNTSTSTTVYPTFTTSSANGNSQAVFNTSISANLSNASITATTFVGALSGAATSATTAGTVTTAAQPNITSVGTLTSLAVTGNVTAGNFVGAFANGNSDINIPAANGNINFDVAGTSNVVVMTATGVNIAGTLNATGNANAGNLGTGRVIATGNISGTQLISNIATGTAPLVVSSTTLVSNLNADLLDGYNTATDATANTVAVRDTNGNITANFFIGNGSQLTGVTATSTFNIANGTSNVSIPAANGNINFSVGGNANMLVVTSTNVQIGSGSGGNITGANVISANLFTGTLTTAAQPNITSVGTLTSLSVTGNANTGNLGTTTLIATTGNITTINGGLMQNGNSNVAITANGNVTISAVGGARLTATATGANVTGTLGVSGNANVGNLGTAQVLATANITAPQLISNVATGTAPFVVTSTTQVANLNVATAGTATTAGTVTTAAQPNITSVGTLTDLNVSGNGVFGGNLTVNGTLTYLNVDTLAVEDPIIQLQTGANGAAPTANSGKDVGTALNYFDTQARVAFMGWDVSNAEFGLASVASISAEVVTFTTYGNLRVGNIIGNGQALTGLAGANVTGQVGNALVAGTVYTAAQPNITSVGTLTSLAVTGNATAGNVYANSGTIGASLLTGTLTTAAQPNITSVGTLTSLTVSGNANLASTSGNVGIGVTAPKTKLQVTGVTTLNAPVLGNAANAPLYVTNSDSAYGLVVGTNAATGHVWLQAQRTDGTATSYNITLNEGGGNVGIGNNAPADRLSVTGNIVSSSYMIQSVSGAVSAAGTVQSNATVLTSQINVVSTVASGAGVQLPNVVAGVRVTIMNTSANALLVYPPTSEIINSQAANAAYSQPAGARLDYISTSATQWYTLNATYG